MADHNKPHPYKGETYTFQGVFTEGTVNLNRLVKLDYYPKDLVPPKDAGKKDTHTSSLYEMNGTYIHITSDTNTGQVVSAHTSCDKKHWAAMSKETASHFKDNLDRSPSISDRKLFLDDYIRVAGAHLEGVFPVGQNPISNVAEACANFKDSPLTPPVPGDTSSRGK